MNTIQESGENYLETIFFLSQGGRQVRAVDVASELNFSKPSVSKAMKKLKQDDYIAIDNEGFIVLTESGLKIAESIYERHLLISGWLISLGVDKKVAIEDACKMEHAMSEQTFTAIRDCVISCTQGHRTHKICEVMGTNQPKQNKLNIENNVRA